MASDPQSLRGVYDGWDGYQLAIVRSVAPRTIDELRWRAAPQLRSAGEIARHIAEGRVDWFSRTFGVEATVPAARVAEWGRNDAVEDDPAELVRGLEASWRMIEEGLARWTVADLAETFPLTYQGTLYALPRQWILWRILSHDLHHGGELAYVLGGQGIALPELGDEGGHLTPPPLAEPS